MARAQQQITQARLAQYRAEVDDAATLAGDFVRSIVEAYQIAYPECSVADIRNYTIDAINDAMQVFGSQTCQIANEFFEELATQAGESVTTEIFDTFDESKMDAKVRVFATDIVNGNVELFNGKIRDITAFYVKREAFENMVRNCGKNNVRYARVPSGRETCSFCFMLASRGFVYWTKETAGQGFAHSYHRHCDCIIVPGFHADTMDANTQIEGYKPNDLYERYRKCFETINPNGTWEEVLKQYQQATTDDTWQEFKTKALMREIETRDWKWLWRGEVPEVDYSEKPRDALTKNEKDAVDWLSLNGIRVKTKIEDPTAVKNIDFEIYSKLYEHKNVTNLSSVSNQIGRSRDKFYRLGIKEMKHVLTLNDTTCDEAAIIDKLRKKVKDNEEIIIVSKEGLIRIKK